jgi:hypothetical protein
VELVLVCTFSGASEGFAGERVVVAAATGTEGEGLSFGLVLAAAEGAASDCVAACGSGSTGGTAAGVPSEGCLGVVFG